MKLTEFEIATLQELIQNELNKIAANKTNTEAEQQMEAALIRLQIFAETSLR